MVKSKFKSQLTIYIILVLFTISILLNILGITGKLNLGILCTSNLPIQKEIIKETIYNTDVKIVETEIPVLIDTNDNEWEIFKCTGYSLNDMEGQGTNNIVANGLNAEKFCDIPIVAVDPGVIPLHSLLEVQGLGGFNALDTGGKVQGNHIDILFPTKEQAVQFGTQYKLVRIIK